VLKRKIFKILNPRLKVYWWLKKIKKNKENKKKVEGPCVICNLNENYIFYFILYFFINGLFLTFRAGPSNSRMTQISDMIGEVEITRHD
jgi:hypothetical protein